MIAKRRFGVAYTNSFRILGVIRLSTSRVPFIGVIRFFIISEVRTTQRKVADLCLIIVWILANQPIPFER